MTIGPINSVRAMSAQPLAQGQPEPVAFETKATPSQETVAQADAVKLGGGTRGSAMAFPGLDSSPAAGLGNVIKRIQDMENATRKAAGVHGV